MPEPRPHGSRMNLVSWKHMPGNEIQYKDAGKTDWFRKSDYAFLDPTLKEWYSYSLWDTPVWSYL